MKLDYFHTVLLNCVNQLNGERTVSAIYHLLKGKKSSQTIQDGKLFNLTHLFGLIPKLSRKQIDAAWELLNQEELIDILPDNLCFITRKGKEVLLKKLEEKPIPSYLDGWQYGDVSRVFWKRLSLLVQVVSNLTYGRKGYLPITKNQEDLQWVKGFLRQSNVQREVLTEKLYKELETVLKLHSSKEATIVVQRLTSCKKIGLTFEQIAYKHDEDPFYVYLVFWNIIHSIIKLQQSRENSFEILNTIIKDKANQAALTISTKVTRSFVLQGKNIKEIATMRKLKESTIEDHIVELTLHDPHYYPSFFLQENDYRKIMKAIEELQTHQLKKVKKYLGHKYSYFQIRLAFALNGRRK
ncbi:helix-turn-helix domain-containing protein [Metabacillus halosaccharovorans]|uniref:Helix-turn-helix domain-containing protein n=1 Tax=Metabacillus halosaccharovorans TaxID=930124 RepID=A0ABT3DNZ1_9BACI|nr:helix-turn-helix domain-containing protein [Metabacillus halosaccharovorans]MCV9888312.1 helix-turn-helix domain-containing protein [Metabacillus halosaccharovorans]